MKKEERCSEFMSTLMVAIPVGTVVALIIEIFMTVDYFAEVSTKHGSMIAGLLGILGVLILVRNQNIETNRLIKSEYEVFEKNKEKALEYLHFTKKI